MSCLCPGNHDLHAGRYKFSCDFRTDSRAAAGHDRDFAS